MDASITSPAPFFTVRFRDNIEKMFNSDCYLQLLLQSIKTQCNCNEQDQIALMAEDQHIINLEDFSLSLQTGRCIFNSRGMYVLLLVQTTEQGTLQYKSLLDDPYMPRDLARKLEEVNNLESQPQAQKVRRLTTVEAPSNKGGQLKRKTSVYTSKPPSRKRKVDVIPTIAE